MKPYIDLRSDTVTTPTPEMRKAMAGAEVGDDVYREDPTVNRLQLRAAEIFGKEAALFVPSGTMGNQIAVKIHTQPGQEVITEARSHIFNYEMATMAALSGCLARPIPAAGGHLTWELVEEQISPNLYYRAQTGLITLENTHNFAGGTIQSAEQTAALVEKAHNRGLPVHLDGARIFNAAAALGTTVADLSRTCDSVMFCLSKGLSAPVGSMLLGSHDFIEQAWRIRKSMGGGMRQVGVLAAAGLIALEEMPKRLNVDHDNARFLAESISGVDGFSVDLESVQTNIVMVQSSVLSAQEVVSGLKDQGVLAGPAGPDQIRFVTHKDVDRTGVEKAFEVIAEMAG